MDTVSKEVRSRSMAAIHSRDTIPEKHIRSSLFARGRRYRKNFAGVPGRPDVYFPRQKVAIFVHGCFWHSHQGCAAARVPKSNKAYWLKKFWANRRRDRDVRRRLLSDGVRVLIVWECTVRRMMADPRHNKRVIREIERFVDGGLPRYLEI